jgi:hypothetical protein
MTHFYPHSTKYQAEIKMYAMFPGTETARGHGRQMDQRGK